MRMPIAKPNGTLDNDVVDAISRLNSWLRSEADWRALNGNIRRAVYYYKSKALSALAGAGRIEARPVAITVVCRDCGGSGEYVDSWGSKYDHCWRCWNSGEVELQFIESRVLPDGPTWHTPRFKAPFNLARLIGDWDEPGLPADGWTVNRPGRELAPAEVAGALNLVEAWVWGAGAQWPREYLIRWYDNAPLYYKLYIGKREATCAFCGTEQMNELRYGAGNLLVLWTDWACDDCDGQFKPAFPPFPEPKELIDSAPVREWLKRREGWRRYNPKMDGLWRGRHSILAEG